MSAVNPDLFTDKGFSLLYDTWSEVMRRDNTGQYTITPQDAVRMLIDSRRAVAVTNRLTDDNLSNLETVAFNYALEVPVLTDEEFLS